MNGELAVMWHVNGNEFHAALHKGFDDLDDAGIVSGGRNLDADEGCDVSFRQACVAPRGQFANCCGFRGFAEMR